VWIEEEGEKRRMIVNIRPVAAPVLDLWNLHLTEGLPRAVDGFWRQGLRQGVIKADFRNETDVWGADEFESVGEEISDKIVNRVGVKQDVAVEASGLLAQMVGLRAKQPTGVVSVASPEMAQTQIAKPMQFQQHPTSAHGHRC
jgi:hypothetical protein